MAQAGFTPISLYFSSTAAAVPTAGNLANGELALNIADMKLYAKNSAGTVTLLASSGGASGTVSSVAVSGGTTGLTTSGGPITTSGTITLAGTLATTNGGTNLTSFTSGGVVYASSSSALATGSALTFDGTNLGVGTAASYKLHVSGTGAVSSRTYATDATGDASFFVGNNDAKLAGPLVYGSTKTAYGALGSNETAFYSNVSTTIMADGASQVIKFAAGGNAEQMRLTSTGLGIGTSSPLAKFDVSSTYASDTTVQARIRDNTGYSLNFTGTASGFKALQVQDSVGAALYTSLLLNPLGGNVGIGTSLPSVKLNVVSTSGGSVVDTLRLSNNAADAGTGSRISFHTADAVFNAIDGARVGGGSGGRLAFYTMGTGGSLTERFRISEDGAFGLSGATYGTSGQVLTSGGSGAAPTWATAGGGGTTMLFCAFSSTMGL